MSKVAVPQFGELLAPFIGAVPPQALPNFLALLERGAAQRYRYWAEQLPQFREGLMRCSASEDEIASTIDAIYSIDESMAEQIKQPLPAARDAYYQVFETLSLPDQLAVQADAELQGANAWRNMLSDSNSDAVQQGLLKCIALEEASSKYLYSIIDQVRAAFADAD